MHFNTKFSTIYFDNFHFLAGLNYNAIIVYILKSYKWKHQFSSAQWLSCV